MIYLTRHASAGSRKRWIGDDRIRPLDARGNAQAIEIADLLFDTGVTRILSSPAVRCVQTMEPLAQKLGLSVQEHGALAEHQSADAARDLVDELVRSETTAVLCSHGDIIPDLVQLLACQGTSLDGPRGWAKGSTWQLEVRDGAVVTASFLGPF